MPLYPVASAMLILCRFIDDEAESLANLNAKKGQPGRPTKLRAIRPAQGPPHNPLEFMPSDYSRGPLLWDDVFNPLRSPSPVEGKKKKKKKKKKTRASER